jgi:hypothetical protein
VNACDGRAWSPGPVGAEPCPRCYAALRQRSDGPPYGTYGGLGGSETR